MYREKKELEGRKQGRENWHTSNKEDRKKDVKLKKKIIIRKER